MSSQIFVYSFTPEIRQLIESDCKSLTGFPPVMHEKIEEVDYMLTILRSADLLLMEMPAEAKSASEFLEKIASRKLSISNIILLGWECREIPWALSLSLNQLTGLKGLIKEILKIEDPKESGWAKIPLHAIFHTPVLPFDLYLKVSEDRYVKRIPAHEKVDEETIQNYLGKGIVEFYFERQYLKDFSKLLITGMINKVEEKSNNPADDIKIRGQVFHTVKDIVQGLGLNPRVVEVCDSLVGSIRQDVAQEPGMFASYIDRIKNNPELSFHHRFIELTSFIGAQLIFAMQELDRQDQVRRLIYAAFFCDMTLSKPDFLHCMNEHGLDKVPPENWEEVWEHARRAAELVKGAKNIPQEVATIIQQHHGSLGGVGFPAVKAVNLRPLSKCLIVSQELAYAILTDSSTPAMKVLKNIADKYAESSIGELINVLEQSLGKETL